MRGINTLIFSLFLLFILCTGIHTHHTPQNSEFNSLIASHSHILGGVFTGNSTYSEYYQVNTSEGERYYRVIRAENGKVLKIQEISYGDYLVYTGKALDMAKSLVEESGKLPPNARLITYTVKNLTAWLYFSIRGGKESTNIQEMGEVHNSSTITSNITSTLTSPGKEFIVATVDLASGNVSIRRASFEELPRWVQNVVRELSMG